MKIEEWKIQTLKDICIKIGSGATPTGGSSAYESSGITLIRSQNVHDFLFSIDGLAYINGLQAKKLNSVTVEKGDILLNITGDSVARACIVPINILPARVNQHVAIIRVDRKKADNRFLFYHLERIKPFLLSSAGIGCTRNALTKSLIESIEILLPQLPEQRAIARILSSLDDKIEMNNRMNKTLEEIAQTLFKRWFVDFEFPDENGNPYKSSGGKMVESELGPIPEGWKYDRLGQYIRIRTGKKDANVSSSNGLYPFFTCAQGELLCDEYSFDAKAIIVAGNGNFSVKWYKGKFEAYQRTYVIDPFDDNFFFLVYYTLIGQIDSFTQGARGSVIKFLTMKNFTDSKVIIPSNSVIKLFHMIITSLQENIFYNKKEIITLSQLRDTLLPKLMSGEIRVPIAEE